MNPWLVHVKKYQKEHNCSYKDALKGAKATYMRGGSLKSTNDWYWKKNRDLFNATSAPMLAVARLAYGV